MSELSAVAAIYFTRAALIGTATETVGYKAGLALTREKSANLVGAEFRELWDGSDEATLRIRAEEFEALVAQLLFKVGAIASPSIAPPGIKQYHRYKSDPELSSIFMSVSNLLLPALDALITEAEKRPDLKTLDPTTLFAIARKAHGEIGVLMAIEMVEEINESLFRSPWANVRRIDWQDRIALEDLFKSESLETQYGSFIDQRFLDYLAANFPEIDTIHWRKFEALTAEFFSREGWDVEIGLGRNDGGVDVRVWSKNHQREDPPAILVQCKRQRSKIEKVVVKALYADVLEEKAKSGLIVTTSALSPGAKQVATARAYPVSEANLEHLLKWLDELRTPGTGAFLAE